MLLSSQLVLIACLLVVLLDVSAAQSTMPRFWELESTSIATSAPNLSQSSGQATATYAGVNRATSSPALPQSGNNSESGQQEPAAGRGTDIDFRISFGGSLDKKRSESRPLIEILMSIRDK